MTRTSPSVKIIYGNGFPHGAAATKRCLHIAKGLKANGIDCEVIVFRGTEREGRYENTSREGIYEGVPYRYIPESLLWPSGLVAKAYNYYTGLFSTLSALAGEDKASTIDSVILAGYYGHLTGWLVTRFCRKRAIPSVLFTDEYPDFMLSPNTRFRLLKMFLLFTVTRRFSVMAVISNALYDYWQPVIGKRVTVLRYPLTAEIFGGISEKSPFDFKYLFYSGFSRMRLGRGFLEKDEPEVLLKAFALAGKSHSGLHLVITGEKNTVLVELAGQLGVEERVVFTGKVGETEYFSMIRHAAACILPRPETLQTKGSIPYRLGEYLLAGGWVISSDVGEIKSIVGNSEGVLFYRPGDEEDLAEKIISALSNCQQESARFDRSDLREKFKPAACAAQLAQLIKNTTIFIQN